MSSPLKLLSRSVVAGLCFVLFTFQATVATAQSDLTIGQKEQFLLNAEVVDSARIGKGVTNPWRLTLSDGNMTHDASFQSVERRRDSERLGNQIELRFADSYHFNIAGFRLAQLLGLEGMVPVTVERRWRGETGSLSWWVDGVMMDEKERVAERLVPTDVAAWNEDVYRMHVFNQLVYNTDPNQGNILYAEGWKLWLIDFTRAFRIWGDLLDTSEILKCDRQLFEKLHELDETEVREKIGRHLTNSEISGLMKRRDKLAEHFEELIAEKGEQVVLY